MHQHWSEVAYAVVTFKDAILMAYERLVGGRRDWDREVRQLVDRLERGNGGGG